MAKNDITPNDTVTELGAVPVAPAEAIVPPAPVDEAVAPTPPAPVDDAVPAETLAPVAAPVVEGPAVAIETVTVTVPVAFQLVIDHATTISINAGIQELPLAHATHWYAIANGVVIYEA